MQERIPVIIDTDIGGDIDDTWALMFALKRPELDVRLITTIFEDTERKTRLVAKMLERVGRTDIPIGRGHRQANTPLNQEAWLGDYSLASYPGQILEDGVQALIDGILNSPQPVTLLAIGPMLNIREALRRAPQIAEKVAHVYAMAGAIKVPYPWKQAVMPEWNVLNDVEGFRMMLAAPWDLTLSPIDGCGDIVLRGERYARVYDSKDEHARVLIENFQQWHQYENIPEGHSSILYDTPVVCMAFDCSYFQFETLPLSVDDKGLTYVDYEHGLPTRCQMGWKKREAFEDLLASSIADEGNAGAKAL